MTPGTSATDMATTPLFGTNVGKPKHWERNAKLDHPGRSKSRSSTRLLYREDKGLDKATLSEDRYIFRHPQKHLGG